MPTNSQILEVIEKFFEEESEYFRKDANGSYTIDSSNLRLAKLADLLVQLIEGSK